MSRDGHEPTRPPSSPAAQQPSSPAAYSSTSPRAHQPTDPAVTDSSLASPAAPIPSHQVVNPFDTPAVAKSGRPAPPPLPTRPTPPPPLPTSRTPPPPLPTRAAPGEEEDSDEEELDELAAGGGGSGGGSGGGGGGAAAPMDTRTRALQEIIESERRYVEVITNLVGIGKSVESAMPPAKYKMIFGTCTMLLNVNTQLLQHLDEVCSGGGGGGGGAIGGSGDGAAVDWTRVCIGDKLNMFFPMFKLYTQYSDQYDAMALTLSQLMGDDDDTEFAQRLHEAMQAHQQTGAFQGLLIQPIQRIPRYRHNLRT